MRQLFFILFGMVFCSDHADYENDVETLVEKDVNFQCLGTSTADPEVTITWTKSNEPPFFYCNPSTPCDKNSTIHSLGGSDTFISIVTIRNVSLIHEDEYFFSMLSRSDRRTCKINLTVIVPPMGLNLWDKADTVNLQNKGSLFIAEGENKTITCQTNTSVKPAVKLNWVTHEGININRDSYSEVQDEQDGRLYVSKQTLSFRPTYMSGKHILLMCKVAANSSFDHIQTSIYITDKGESTTESESLSSCSKEKPTLTTSNGDLKATESPYTTHMASSSTESYNPRVLTIALCSGVVILLLALAFVVGVILCRKTAGSASESSDLRIRTLPRTTSHQPVFSQEAPQGNIGTSQDSKDEDAEVFGENAAVQSSASFYMEMKPITRPKLVFNSPNISDIMASTDVQSNYTSPASTKKFAETDQGLRKEHTYVNTHDIVLAPSKSLDDVSTTYL